MLTTNGRPTTLKEGDCCVWNKAHGTVCIRRGAENLHNEGGDDKYLIRPNNLLEFQEICTLLASVVDPRFATELESEEGHLVTYRFVRWQ